MASIFQDPTKTLPRRDPQIVRVPMTDMDIAARKDHMPAADKSGDMSISHTPNAGSKT